MNASALPEFPPPSPSLTGNSTRAPYDPTVAFPATAPRNAKLILGLFWLAIYFAALFAPPLLDDADATHASAARAMLTTGDWVTLHVDGIRYLEKAPLPYWLVAISFRIFGFNAFATHLPSALAVLALTALAWRWAARAFNQRTAFYAALATLTSVGVFLFTRIFIPEILLSLFLALALYSFLRSLEAASATTSRHSERSGKSPQTFTHLNSSSHFQATKASAYHP